MSKELSHLKTVKQQFCDAYLQLLLQHEPAYISVKQIVLVANASRSSFYTYFDNREQLHAYVKSHIHDAFLQHYVQPAATTHERQTTFTLCHHILRYRAYYQHAFRNTAELHDMAMTLSTYLQEVYDDKDYAIFASFGTIGYLKNWVEEGFIISPSEAAEKLLKIGFTNWASRIDT